MSFTTTYRFRVTAFALLNLVRLATVVALLVGAAAQLVSLAANLASRANDQSDGLVNETGYFPSTDIPTAAGGTVGFALGHILFGQSLGLSVCACRCRVRRLGAVLQGVGKPGLGKS
jgi:hypothetical protein